MLPEITEYGKLFTGNVVGDWDARKLYDATFNGVHQRKITHGPRKQGSLGIAGATKEKRCRGKIDDLRYPEFSFDRLKAVNPQTCRFTVFLCFQLVVGCEVGFISVSRFFAITVM